MRVVAGEFRGRRLVAPDGTTTRPTTDRVREAVFNSLSVQGLLQEAAVVDLFAGSGAMGIEALSRGAARCTFVEKDRHALRALRDNLAALGIGSDRATVVAADALAWSRAMSPVDVLIADPPYDFAEWSELLTHARTAFIVAESGAPIRCTCERWTTTREKRYGRTVVSFLEPADATAHTDEDA